MGNLAALLLRLVVGSLLAGHGAQKLFGSFGGPGLEGTSGFMEMLGLTPGKPWAFMAGLSEVGGGVLTALGFLNPMGPLGIIGAMAMAAVKAHSGKPIWVTEGGAELPVINIAAATTIMLNGPGKYSLDHALGIRLPRWLAPLGLVAVILTVMYADAGTEESPEQDEAREGAAGDDEA
ncbi:MAG TPA: DoxX family protein [Rubrobacter sp.]